MTDLQALLEAYRSTRLLRLSFPMSDGPHAMLVVNRFEGTEYMSRDFEFKVELLSDDAGIELETMHGKLLCVSLVQIDGSLRPFTGYVASFKLVKTDGGVVFYDAVLKPWLAYTRLRRNNRLFHAQSLREQAETIFADYGGLPAWEWEVTGEQPQLTMATQWDETDHNYLCRRWEAAGYSYWYEHSGEGHMLRVCDDTRTSAPIDGPSPGIRFHGAGGAAEENAINHWSPLRRWASGQAAVSGFDFKNPRPVHADIVTVNSKAMFRSWRCTATRGITASRASRAATNLRACAWKKSKPAASWSKPEATTGKSRRADGSSCLSISAKARPANS